MAPTRVLLPNKDSMLQILSYIFSLVASSSVYPQEGAHECGKLIGLLLKTNQTQYNDIEE